MSVLATALERAPSATLAQLRQLRAVLAALAILAGGMALLVSWEEHADVVAAGTHTATAVIQTYAAAQALTDADSQAVQNVPQGAGPPGQYQADIAAGEQSLEQVAENNTAGASGTQSLQLIEGLIPAYTGLVEQADTRFSVQAGTGNGVGVEDLWSASELMHQEILAGQNSLASLRTSEQDTLDSQRSSPWVSPWLNALWIIPALALLGMLAATQRFLYRRMRRLLSKYLTLTAAAVIALCVTTSHVIVSEHAFSVTSGPLATVLTLQDWQTYSTDEHGQTMLVHLIGSTCAQCSAEQAVADMIVDADGNQVQMAEATVQRTCGAQGDIPGCITDQERSYSADAARAQSGYGTSMAFIAVLTVLLLLLIPLGLRRYLDEYRQA